MTAAAAPRIALNLADCTRYDTTIRALMIAPALGTTPDTVRTGLNLDDDSVVLSCPETQARAIVEFLRTSVDRRLKQYPIRAYQSGPRGGWTKIA